jgi:Tol biopolymer transport system component/DNA-binding winged helix-turn-helix (wHTH) protein
VTVFRFDDVVVDTTAFRAERRGALIPLEPKAFDLLVLLLEREGRLVTKQEILDVVWPDTAVTDNALTRIVAHLRKALDDDARAARYIETVPTRGYRWLTPVRRDEGSPERPSAPGRSTPYRDRRRAGVVAVLAVAAAVAAFGVARRNVRSRPAGGPAIESLWPTQATVSPRLDAFPALAPDGRTLAYASVRNGGFEIVAKSLAAGSREVPLTSDGQQNVQPAWSPDGEYVAYHSVRRGGIWIIAALGGVPRQVTEFGSAPAWSPDGRRIAFQSHPLADIAPSAFSANVPSTIWTVGRDGSDLRRLTVSTNPLGGHGSPAWSPDGRRIVFTTYSAAPSRLWSVEASGGSPSLLVEARVSIHDPVFAPDGSAVYYATGGPYVVRVPLSVDTGLPQGEPVALSTPGIPTARYLSISGDGRRIAMAALSLKSNLWSVSVSPASGAAVAPPVALTDDTSRRKTTPAFSPDGEWIAYGGSRAGAGSDIWVINARDGRTQPVTTGDPTTGKDAGSNYRPSWFPDSARVAFLANDGVRTTYQVADLTSRRAQPLMPVRVLAPPGGAVNSGPNPVIDYRLSPDGRDVAFSKIDARSGMPRLYVTPLGGGGTRALGAGDQAESYPAWSPDGQWIASEVRTDRGSVVGLRPSSGGPLRLLTSGPGESWVHGWAPDNDRVLFAGLRGGVWNVWWVSRSTGREKQVTRYAGVDGFVRYPTWSPRGDRIVYELAEVRGNIWMSALPGTGERQAMRLHRPQPSP